MHERTRGISHQAAALLGAAIGWCLWPGAGLFFLLGCYLAVLVATQAASYFGGRLLPALTPGQKAVGLAVLIVVLLFTALHSGMPLAESEGWKATTAQLSDRWALEKQPVLYPRQIDGAQPQRFYVYDEGAEAVGMNVGETPLAARSLGAGVWCFDYDPRRDGFPFEHSGTAEIQLTVDGSAVSRELTALVPQPHPRWPRASAPLGLGACVSEETDELYCVDRLGNRLRFATGDGPTDCAVLADATVAVCHRYAPEVWFIDAQSGEVRTKLPTSAWQNRLELSPDGQWLAVAIDGPEPGIGWIEVAERRYAGKTPLGFQPEWLAFGPDDLTLVASCTRDQSLRLLKADGSADPAAWQEALQPIYLGRPARSICRGADGSHVYFTASGWNSAGGRDVGGNHFVEHLILGLDVAAWKVTERFNTEGRSHAQNAPGASDLGLDPVGLAAIDAETLMVTYSGSNHIGPFRLAGGNPARPRSLAKAGVRVPFGLADLGEGHWLVADPAGAALAVYNEKENACRLVALGLSDDELAERDPLALRQRQGEIVFFEGTRSGISCNSCHMNADSDYGRHDISDFTPTLSVRGIAGTAPYLRVPSYGSLVELHQKLAGGLFGGYSQAVDYDRAEALDAFVTTLSRPVNPRWSTTPIARMKEGMDAFTKGGCARCHAPPAFTNLAQHSEEWLFPERTHAYGRLLDTPSLLQAAAKSQWLVDGRGKSIATVIENENPSNRHGDTAALSPEERQALVALIESL